MLSLVLTDSQRPDAPLRRVGIDTLPVTLGGSPDCDIALDDPALSDWSGTLRRAKDGRLWLRGNTAMLRAGENQPMCSELEIRPGVALELGRLRLLLESIGPATARPESSIGRGHFLRAPLAMLAILSAVFLEIWMNAHGPRPFDKILSNLVVTGALIGILLLVALCIDKLIGRAFDASATLIRLSAVFVLIVGGEAGYSMASFALGLPPLNLNDAATISLWSLGLGLALLSPSFSLLRRWRRSHNLAPFLTIALLLSGSGTVMALHDADDTRQTSIGQTFPPSFRLIGIEDASEVLAELQGMHESLEKMRRDAPPVQAED
ncbi:hypothetical protein [Methyloversatilis discipulorum]|uniref:hypothetical protein n=1 Tax=Methyloversatilis discipulorum TaxID=1119528 RepID=UPI0012FC4E4C|nr:hypothetical protein [Methyloversatilis discipulorum]